MPPACAGHGMRRPPIGRIAAQARRDQGGGRADLLIFNHGLGRGFLLCFQLLALFVRRGIVRRCLVVVAK